MVALGEPMLGKEAAALGVATESVPAAQVHDAYMASLAFAYASVVSADEFLKA